MENSSAPLGYLWLSRHTGIEPVQPLRRTSSVGKVREVQVDGAHEHRTYPRAYEPEPSLAGHLTFALKHEGVALEFLARLFEASDGAFISEWIAREPTSAYARRVGFFYEWLTGREVPAMARPPSGNYVDALDPSAYLVATTPQKIRRWRVNDNLPGTPAFCPTIERWDGLLQPEAIQEQLDGLYRRFGPETIERAVAWLSVKESRASFVIEHEGKEEDRIARFARCMAEHCGRLDDPLSDEAIRRVQDAVLGEAHTGIARGLRASPVFVGHVSGLQNVVDYLAPPHEALEGMVDGLRAAAARTRGQNALLRAAAIAYGFVYIHPLSDGNGRLSRFLINDTLLRDGVIAPPLILPVSVVISANASSRHGYMQSLDLLSRPLMRRLGESIGFGERRRYADGVESNLVVRNWRWPMATWRYPDLTLQSRYLLDVIARSVQVELLDEALYLQAYDRAQTALKELVEGTSEHYATIIRSIQQNQGVSGKLRKTFPAVFDDEVLAGRVAAAVLKAFESGADAEDAVEPVLDVQPRGKRPRRRP